MLLKKEKKRKIPFTIIGLSDRVRKLTRYANSKKFNQTKINRH